MGDFGEGNLQVEKIIKGQKLGKQNLPVEARERCWSCLQNYDFGILSDRLVDWIEWEVQKNVGTVCLIEESK